MKKTIKVLAIVLSIIFVVVLALLFVGSIFIHKIMEKETGEELSYFQSIKMVTSLNYDSEIERELKEKRIKEDYYHISIYYSNDFSELMPLTKETLDWAITRNEEVFGKVNLRSMDFIVFDDKEEMEKFAELIDVLGYYSDYDKLLGIAYYDKQSILERNETALYHFQEIILHEYTHYIFNRKVEDTTLGVSAYPIWFQEGLAEYIGNDKAIIEYSVFQIVHFEKLIDVEQWGKARLQNDTDVYRQSYFAIKYLVDEFGEKILSDIIDSTNSTGDFEESLNEVTGMNIHKLESDFLNSYKE